MLLRETGFSFGGVHSRDDMGLIYAEKDGHIAIPEIKRNTYNIAGMSGTLLMEGEAWQPFNLEGTLYPADEPASQAEAQALIRRVASWLTAGRKKLIFDYEPGVYYLAELSAASKWSLKNWFGGELPVRWTVQPFAYSVSAKSATANITGTSTSLSLNLQTGQPAPLKLTVKNTGTANITKVSVGGITLDGMKLTAGKTLTIESEMPAGARIGNANALPYAQSFAPVMLGEGVNYVVVTLAYAESGDPGATVTASARGRW